MKLLNVHICRCLCHYLLHEGLSRGHLPAFFATFVQPCPAGLGIAYRASWNQWNQEMWSWRYFNCVRKCFGQSKRVSTWKTPETRRQFLSISFPSLTFWGWLYKNDTKPMWNKHLTHFLMHCPWSSCAFCLIFSTKLKVPEFVGTNLEIRPRKWENQWLTKRFSTHKAWGWCFMFKQFQNEKIWWNQPPKFCRIRI